MQANQKFVYILLKILWNELKDYTDYDWQNVWINMHEINSYVLSNMNPMDNFVYVYTVLKGKQVKKNNVLVKLN